MADEDKVHVYFRDPKGRIVTHFLVPMTQFRYWEMAASALKLTMDEFVSEAIRMQFERLEADKHG